MILITLAFIFLFIYVPILDPMIAPIATANPIKKSNLIVINLPITPGMALKRTIIREVPIATFSGILNINTKRGTYKNLPPTPSIPNANPAGNATDIILRYDFLWGIRFLELSMFFMFGSFFIKKSASAKNTAPR